MESYKEQSSNQAIRLQHSITSTLWHDLIDVGLCLPPQILNQNSLFPLIINLVGKFLKIEKTLGCR